MGGGGKHYSAPKVQEVEIPAPAPVENKVVKEKTNKKKKRNKR